MLKPIKILLVGETQGAYRSQILVKHLLDHCDEYAVSMSCDRFYLPRYAKTSKLMKPVKKALVGLLRKPLSLCSLFVKIWFADVIYLLPMNHGWMLRIMLANLLWRKPVITDHYISIYETGVDRQEYKSERSLKAVYHRFLDRLMIEHSTKILFSTKDDAVQVSQSVGAKLDLGRVAIVPICTAWKPLAEPTPANTFRICWWGTWIPLHGLENILAAMEILVKEGVDFHLDLLGTARGERFRYAQLIQNLNLGDRVTIHCDKTFVDGGLQAYLREHCDLALGIFGTSPKARRGIPNKVIDAFAMKLPVLAMDNDGAREFIDPDNEMFVSGNRPEEIAQAIRGIISQPAERQRRAALGYERFRKSFTSSEYKRQIDALIHHCVSPAGAG